MISSSGQKRKRDEGFIDGCGGMKRSKSDDSHTVDVDTDMRKYEPDTGNIHSVEEAEVDSLAGRESEAYGNCIHCCLVFSPAGRLLHSYRSSRKLLEALRDVNTSHKRDSSFVLRSSRDEQHILLYVAHHGSQEVHTVG
jgi:Fungal protein kinase